MRPPRSRRRGPTRRQLLLGSAAGAMGLVLGCGGTPSAAGEGDLLAPPVDGGAADRAGADDLAPARDLATAPVEPPEPIPPSGAFGLGVASGDVTPERVVIQTRYDGKSPLQLWLFEMSGDTYVRRLAAVDVAPGDGGFVVLDVPGLAPSLRYRYCFVEMAGDKAVGRSPIGRFRAAIGADELVPLSLGAVSCTKNDRTFETIQRASARADFATFLLLGDTTYNDGAKSVADYRKKWAENLSTAAYRSLRQNLSVTATWDDHEVENNWDPEKIGGNQLAAARQAFFENLPVRRDPQAPERLWRRLRWGKTLEVFVLDCRSERKPSTRKSANATYISRAQMDWLKSGLKGSPAVFKVIMNSVPIADFPLALDLAADDRWEGYAAQRTEILEHVEKESINGVLWVSGDFHIAAMGRVSSKGLGQYAVEILAGPGAYLGNPLAFLLNAPQWDWASTTNNYTALHFEPQGRTVRVAFHDAGDKIVAERSYRL